MELLAQLLNDYGLKGVAVAILVYLLKILKNSNITLDYRGRKKKK